MESVLAQSKDIPLWGWTIIGVVAYFTGLVMYRLYFHPLAKFPGPKLAAASFLYEFYYDAILPGRYTWHLKDLHAKYGPIIRSNPNEIHINDPDFFDDVYPSGAKRRIDKPYAKMFGISTDIFSAVSHEKHKAYRNVVNPYFSRRAVLNIERSIQVIIEELCTRFEAAAHTGELISVGYAYAALTSDVINEYCFAKTHHAVLMPDFNKATYESFLGFTKLGNITKTMPSLLILLRMTPQWLLGKLSPHFGQGFRVQAEYAQRIKDIKEGKDSSHEKSDHPTLFHALIESHLPEAEKTPDHLKDWAQTFLTAGMFTVGHTLKCATYHILANKHVRDKLLAEIDAACPDPNGIPSLIELEKLPYLTNVLNESLRMSYGVSKRLTRSQPDNVLRYGEWVIPAGTPVGMTAILIHDNPDIFPEPFEFRPERWDGEAGRRLQKYLVAFNKGSRVCIGMGLAWAELYKTLASLLRRYDLELVGAIRERDVDASRDYFNAEVSEDSPGLFVKVTGKRA
ncbi:Trichodiene oxygenase [Pleurostoma richardsiae]|uniref:Trichodiene oxygenase n=1 Tax=Pleurostoma richardsiae TaxID=41990 RepID=A0AA38S5Z5_9PEZI|nr:Trichodiene oxygenase [Pleurostoma richardsiae]